MKTHVTQSLWTGAAYGVIKRVVIPYEYGLVMTDAMLQYADEHGYTLALTGDNGMACLYWNREGQIVRLAVEEVK